MPVGDRSGYDKGYVRCLDCQNMEIYWIGDRACMHKSAAGEGSYVLVYTADGKEYMGELCLAGVSESSKEITLRNPAVVLRDSEGCVLGDFEIGKNILFKENDVRRVVFLKDIA